MSKLTLLVSAGFIAVFSSLLFAQVPPVREPVARGTVVPPIRLMGVFDEDSGQPLEGVEVMDMATGTSALTTSTGTVSLMFLAPGGSLVRIRKLGFGVQTITIPMSPSDTNGVTVTLKRVAELPAVVTRDTAPRRYISSALRAFEERRKLGHGYFIDETVLRKEDNRTLGNLLMAHAPGVTIKQASGSAAFLLKSARCTNGGMPDVYVDGVALAHLPDRRWPESPRSRSGDTRDVPIDLSQFQVSDLGGVEYYPDNATMPVQFSRTSAGCGALMLWTRER